MLTGTSCPASRPRASLGDSKGEEHNAHGLSFRIEDANERAILKVRVRKLPAPAEPVEAGEPPSGG